MSKQKKSVSVLIEGYIHDSRDYPVIGYQEGDNYVTGIEEFPNFGSPDLYRNGEIRRDQLGELPSLIKILNRDGDPTDVILLIDSIGGRTQVASRIASACQLAEAQGGDVWAFNRGEAKSAAGWLFVDAKRRVANFWAETMLHQGIMYRKSPRGQSLEATVPLTYAEHPEIFRNRVHRWIETNLSGTARDEAHEIVQEAITGCNPLDDIYLLCEQLEKWGLLDRVTQTPSEFTDFYHEITGIPPELLPKQFKDFLQK